MKKISKELIRKYLEKLRKEQPKENNDSYSLNTAYVNQPQSGTRVSDILFFYDK